MVTHFKKQDNTNLRIKCMIDSYDEFEELKYFFDEEALLDIQGEPDLDGKYRFIVEVIRISGAEPKGTK